MASPYDEKLRSLGDGTMTNTAPTGYPQPAYAPAGVPTRGPQQILRPTSAVGSPIAPEDSLRLAQTTAGGMGVDTGPAAPAGPTNLNSLVQNLFGGNGFSGKAPAPSLPQASYSNEGYNRPPLASPTAPAVPAASPLPENNLIEPNQSVIDQDLRAAAHSRSMGDRSLELAKQGVFGPTPGMGIIDSAGAAGAARQSFFDDANLRSAAAKGSWSPRKGYQGDEGAVRAAMVPIQNRQRLSEISLKNVNDQSLASMQDSTQRRGQDVAATNAAARDATDRRGQDVSLRGQDVNARTAAMAARADQMNKDRQFGLDTQKFGQEVASKNFDIRQKAQKDVTEQVAGLLPPGADGKPDTANAARYASSLNALVAQRTERLRAQLAKTPDRQDVQQELQALETRGLAAMDQKAIRDFVSGQKAADLAGQTATGSYTPWGTNAANSTAPITSLRERKGLFGSDYVSDRGDVIPGRYLREDGKFNQDLRGLIKQ